MSIIVSLLLGIPLLVWGRNLFWFFVGALGFIAGFILANRFLTTDEQWIVLAVSAALGLIGVLLALSVQKFALTVAGFIAGAYLVYQLTINLSVSFHEWNWLVYVIGGIIGSLLILSVFDWALILLSSLVGASLISQTSFQLANFEFGPRTILFFVLLIVGLLVQGAQKQRDT
jgi:hypothetical protein